LKERTESRPLPKKSRREVMDHHCGVSGGKDSTSSEQGKKVKGEKGPLGNKRSTKGKEKDWKGSCKKYPKGLSTSTDKL